MPENTGKTSPAPAPRARTVAEIREKLLLNRKATDEKIKSARMSRDALRTPTRVPRSAFANLSLGNSPLALNSERARTPSNNYYNPARFGSPNLGPEEYLLGLPLGTDSSNGVAQRAAYISAITAKSEMIDKFLNHPFPAPEELAGEMDKLIAECRLIAVHPDLPCAEIDPRDVDFEKESKSYITMSPKFSFLKKLFDSISELSIKIEIVASPGRTIDMLEIFFRGIKVHCTRRDKLSQLPRLSVNEQKGFSKVALLPSIKSGAVVVSADLVIAMDSTFVADVPEIVRVRENLFVVGKLAPVLRLVSLNTLEHIELCYKDSEPRHPALYTYIETTKNLLHDTGALVDSYKPTFAAAVPNTAEWLSKNPIEGAPKLEGFPLLPIFEPLPQAPTLGLHDKRKREGEPTEEQSSGSTPPAAIIQTKRLRIAGPINSPTISPPSQQMGTATPTKNPMPIQSTAPAEPEAHLSSLAMQIDGDDVGATSPVDDGPPKSWVYITEEAVDKMEPADLKETLKSGKRAFQEWKSFALLTQDTVEQQRESFMALQAEKDGLVKVLSKAEAREKRLDSELSKLRDDLKQANLAVQKAKADLSSAADPLPIIGQLRDENEQLQKKLESMGRREKANEAEFEFLREQYQNATSSGVELRKELDQMKADNALLQRRAAATVVELHQSHVSSQLDNYRSQVASLQSKLLERESRLARMEEHASEIPITRGRALLVDRAATTTPAGSHHPEPVSQTPTTLTDRSTNSLP